MPTAPLRPCAFVGCPELVPRGRCPTHAVQQEHQRSNYDIRRWYRQARWKRLRGQVLRDNPLCVECQQEQRVTLATDVHHRVRHEGDVNKFFNRALLEGLCARHHSMRTAKGE